MCIRDRTYTALGRVDDQNKTTQLRIDFFVDELSEQEYLFGSEVFNLSDGQSALLHAEFNQGSITWLITPNQSDRNPTENKENSVPQIATKPE